MVGNDTDIVLLQFLVLKSEFEWRHMPQKYHSITGTESTNIINVKMLSNSNKIKENKMKLTAQKKNFPTLLPNANKNLTKLIQLHLFFYYSASRIRNRILSPKKVSFKNIKALSLIYIYILKHQMRGCLTPTCMYIASNWLRWSEAITLPNRKGS